MTFKWALACWASHDCIGHTDPRSSGLAVTGFQALSLLGRSNEQKVLSIYISLVGHYTEGQCVTAIAAPTTHQR
jgi:hypothetical protein